VGKLTNLQLEHDTYEKLILGDVNNYIAVNSPKTVDHDTMLQIKTDNPHYLFKQQGDSYEVYATKCKGRFEFFDLALHKNKSFLVIPKAIYYYFVHGINPEQYIKEETNIFDFCGGKRIKGDWGFHLEYIENGVHKKEDVQNTIRYYISNKGGKILKRNYLDERVTQVEAGKWYQTLFINYVKKDIKQHDLNYDYYLQKIMKEIHSLEPIKNQLSLF
jgi:hypothetical protein